MAMAQVAGPSRLDPHATRRALRAEKAELVRWRRLLRARLDLAVASYAPPETLGVMSWDMLPTAMLSLPLPQTLREVVSLHPEEDRVGRMHQLRALDHDLAAYGAALDHALERCTEDLLAQLARADDVLPRPKDPR